jgi:hypothetical protein
MQRRIPRQPFMLMPLLRLTPQRDLMRLRLVRARQQEQHNLMQQHDLHSHTLRPLVRTRQRGPIAFRDRARLLRVPLVPPGPTDLAGRPADPSDRLHSVDRSAEEAEAIPLGVVGLLVEAILPGHLRSRTEAVEAGMTAKTDTKQLKTA